MAAVNLLPNADVNNSPAWTLASGSDIYALLDDDASNPPNLDVGQITATSASKRCTLAFQDFDDTGVASIDSVTAVIKHNNNGRGRTYELGMSILSSSGTFWAEESTGTVSANMNWLTTTFTVRETSTALGVAWTNSDLDDIRMQIDLDATTGGTTRVGYAYFKVIYTVAAVTNDAVFFGTNF